MSIRHLYLLRHARTQEFQDSQSDFDRELTGIGLQNSTRMGIYLNSKKTEFQIIICSPALRAKTTAELIAEQLKRDPETIYFNDEIYEASVRTLLDVINKFKNEWNSVLLVGHNPSITYLAEYLTGEAIGNITPCGLVELKFEGLDWQMIGENTGVFVEYTYPEKLNF